MDADETGGAHNPKVAGSNPAPATTKSLEVEASERSEVFPFKAQELFDLV